MAGNISSTGSSANILTKLHKHFQEASLDELKSLAEDFFASSVIEPSTKSDGDSIGLDAVLVDIGESSTTPEEIDIEDIEIEGVEKDTLSLAPPSLIETLEDCKSLSEFFFELSKAPENEKEFLLSATDLEMHGYSSIEGFAKGELFKEFVERLKTHPAFSIPLIDIALTNQILDGDNSSTIEDSIGSSDKPGPVIEKLKLLLKNEALDEK